jgi:hypothetical protein
VDRTILARQSMQLFTSARSLKKLPFGILKSIITRFPFSKKERSLEKMNAPSKKPFAPLTLVRFQVLREELLYAFYIDAALALTTPLFFEFKRQLNK